MAVSQMEEGKQVALITDAGTPGISDPGEELVAMCWEAGIPVTSVPGPAACITAPYHVRPACTAVFIRGFSASEKKERRAILEEMKTDTRTLILYEAPIVLVKTLKSFFMSWKPEDRGVQGTDQKHETVFKGTLEEAWKWYQDNPPKGSAFWCWKESPEKRSLKKREKNGGYVCGRAHGTVSGPGYGEEGGYEAGAKDRGVSKRDIYQILLQES